LPKNLVRNERTQTEKKKKKLRAEKKEYDK
jgi:hypothetical protein